MEKREDRDRLLKEKFPNRPYITEICIDFRMAVNGAGDPISDEEEQEFLRLLNIILDTWQEDNDPWRKRLDDAIKEIVAATIAETEAIILNRKKY